MRLSLSLVAAVVGAALLVTAGVAVARPQEEKVFRINLISEVYSLDPALAYYVGEWELEYATCAKLFNHPDAEASRGLRLVPEVATAFPRVSRDGRTYSVTIRSGGDVYRFSDGSRVTAASFAHQIRRVRNSRQSVGDRYLHDIERVSVRGNDLILTVTRPASDLIARLALPFFCAVPETTPLAPDRVHAPPSAGPYYVAERVFRSVITLRRNPHYRGPRPQGVDAIVYTFGVYGTAVKEKIEAGELDYAADGVVPSAYAELAARHGVNKGRFFAKPTLGLRYIRVNLESPLFKNNPHLRRAIGYAVDRPEVVRRSGAFAGRRTDQILPSSMPGFHEAAVYPTRGADYRKARRLARGRTRSGRATLLCFHCAGADVIAYNLRRIGIDLEIRPCARGCGARLTGDRCERLAGYDLYLDSSFADYGDPRTFLDPETKDGPLACYRSHEYRERFARANRLPPPQRPAALGLLDVETMRRNAPIVSLYVANRRIFVSARTTNVIVHPIYGLDLAAVRVR